MSDQKSNELNNEQLNDVNGGQFIDPKTKAPNYTGPYVGMAYKGTSIAQQEINSNATDDNMTDSGGGVIA
jgi:hypothetical protein